MPETDVGKMKVADLKRELKLRGLSTTGNKTELQERLQNALIDGELSLEDTAISGEDLLDGDAVLTDEEEAKILGGDENELLQSPTTTPITIPELDINTAKAENLEQKSPPAKKIILKRKSSFTTIGSGATVVGASANSTDVAAIITKENTEPPTVKLTKMSDHNPITLTNTNQKDKAMTKISQLSLQERLEMRAKKFGTTTNSGTKGDESNTANNGSSNATNEQQMAMLKKRAERFGCVVSSKIAKLDAEEKLQKRKQRFGVTLNTDADKTESSSVWLEKARQRLERFKTSAVTTPSTAATTVAKN